MTNTQLKQYMSVLESLNLVYADKEELLDYIAQNTCSCYYYAYQNSREMLDLHEIMSLLEQGYYSMHYENDDLDECPEYLQEKAEMLGEIQADMERGN